MRIKGRLESKRVSLLAVMKTFILLALVAACSTVIVQVPTHQTGSLRAKLIREGKYSAFLAKQHAARVEQLASDNQPINDYYDDFYLGNISVGMPGDIFFEL